MRFSGPSPATVWSFQIGALVVVLFRKDAPVKFLSFNWPQPPPTKPRNLLWGRLAIDWYPKRIMKLTTKPFPRALR